MFDFSGALLRHAIENAWANPEQDRQLLIKPMLVTPSYGVRGSHRTPFQTYPAPNVTERWAIYEYGSLNPKLIGLEKTNLVWRDAVEIMEGENLVMFPMLNQRMCQFDSVKVMRINDNNVLFAVSIDKNKALFDITDDLYIRFYSNSWFNQPGAPAPISAVSKLCEVEQDIADTIADYLARGFTEGHTFWFRNGYFIERPTVVEIDVGDTLQWVHDPSGTEMFDIPFTDFVSFMSARDNMAKGTVITPGFVDEDFLFYDDVEFFVCGTDLNGRTIGCYHDRQENTQLTQITHRDWAFNTQRLNELVIQHGGEIPLGGAFVRVFLRKTTNGDVNVGDGQYLDDFYSLDYGIRHAILSGGAGTFEPWRASNLEASAFMKWLNTPGHELNEAGMKNVYNYYGVVKALHYPVKQSDTLWTLPEAAREGCVVINLDADGSLHSYQHYANGANPGNTHAVPTDVKDIIVYCGEDIADASAMDTTVNGDNDIPGEMDEERFYKLSGALTWVKATYGTDYTYNALSGRVEWSAPLFSADKMKRSSKYLSLRTVTVPFSDLTKPINIFSGGSIPATKFDFGRVDVWFNGRKLAAGMEYTHKDFKLYLHTLEHLDYVDPAQEVEVVLIAHALPNDVEDGQFGFMVDGMVNHDTDVDLVRNRNFRLFIEGQLKSLEDVYLAEAYRGEYEFTPTVLELPQWLEGTTYPAGSMVRYGEVAYFTSVEVKASAVFEEADWGRIWTSIPYFLDGTTDTHVVLFVYGNKLMQKVVYKDGAEVNTDVTSDVDLSTKYVAKKGLPLVTPDNAKLYHFSGKSNSVSRFTIEKFSDSREEAATKTATLAAYLNTVLPQVEVGVINIPRQIQVVSSFLSEVTRALKANIIIPNGTDLSDAAIDFLTRDYQYLLDGDPCGQPSYDYDFIACYGHAEKDPIGLSSEQYSLIRRLNEYFFASRVNVARDFFIN
ncbi:hypothetical protein [Vibrio phage vB_VmeM-Yong MS32]|nr:hypothetical protein [Vibrio phage vB_VmeM-Yong MS31]QAX97057.1 hypothetical protein [Vibrio phage vB_VmeM-Yong MS32]